MARVPLAGYRGKVDADILEQGHGVLQRLERKMPTGFEFGISGLHWKVASQGSMHRAIIE